VKTTGVLALFVSLVFQYLFKDGNLKAFNVNSAKFNADRPIASLTVPDQMLRVCSPLKSVLLRMKSFKN